jgi:hypothetical protein
MHSWSFAQVRGFIPTRSHREQVLAKMPTAEIVQEELASAKSIDDFFGKEGFCVLPACLPRRSSSFWKSKFLCIWATNPTRRLGVTPAIRVTANVATNLTLILKFLKLKAQSSPLTA